MEEQTPHFEVSAREKTQGIIDAEQMEMAKIEIFQEIDDFRKAIKQVTTAIKKFPNQRESLMEELDVLKSEIVYKYAMVKALVNFTEDV
tara:strand:+ start:3383 stop:3649 length:267 start_codon:yes stop_codon:yes gene_type:complete